jgi:hypothetical protein
MMFENHEMRQLLIISYVEVVIKSETVLNTSTRTLFRKQNISRVVSKNLN